jgi:4-alpha-glucanotransferase
MQRRRTGGILVHPTSFPGQHGIGDLGPAAIAFIEFLSDSGMGLWQVLPLNPTGYGDSPYQGFSAFAGNPYLISPEELYADGLLSSEDLGECPEFPDGYVDFGRVIPWKRELLVRAHARLGKVPALQEAFEAFRAGAGWLEDYAIFMALKDAHTGAAWVDWSAEYRQRDPQAMAELRAGQPDAIERHAFGQFLFFRQWAKLREFAAGRGVKIIGDIPIYVSHDSADVWAHPEFFALDETGRPTVVAGVPPDYFSKYGQLWGNPIYRWERLARDGFAWWIERMRATLESVDFIRLDHFRGFAGYWEVPANEETAVNGRWVPGPGAALFTALEEALGPLPVIAEDLGEITPDVIELRDRFGFPGMKILQFGFSGDPDHEFLPHTYPENCVAYTGTHDNETALGWYRNAEESHKRFARKYLKSDGREIYWDLIARLWESPARMVLAQLQDFLGVGDEGRMNYPSRPSGNWQWRFGKHDLTKALEDRVRRLSERTLRMAV